MIRKLLRPPRRRLVSGLVLLVVLSAGIGGWLLLRDDTPAAATTTTATVGKQTLAQTVPASGTVAAAKTADLSIEVGDTVGSGAPSSGSGTDTTGTISIVSGGRFQVDAKVASGDVAKVKKGMQAELTVSGVDGTVYGTVAEVGLVAETDSSGAAVFPVTVDVTGKRTDLYAGTSADVAIIVSRRTDVLTVDSRALKTDGTTTYVEKVTDAATGATTRVDVKTGETSGLLTEVTSGLADGDVVQVPGFTLPGGTGGNNQQQQFRQRLQNGGGFPEGGFPGGGVPNFPGGPQ